ncbi:MAG: electron transfer flavoprotein, partial [Rhodothermales bacterium]|nr:electron transfer flavoprotein [Rhodothermales bacterium]
GIAGLSAAMVLARANKRFLLIERGEFCGAKNVSGGVLWGSDLEKLVPNYAVEEDAAIERFVTHRRLTFVDEQSAFSIDFKSDHFAKAPYSGLIVLRAKFDEWLAAKVQETIDASSAADESFLATNILVDRVLVDDERVTGIQAGEETFQAHCVILAEGVNNLLTRQIGLQSDYVPADHMAIGVKEVIGLGQETIEERFQLDGRAGMTNEFVGFATRGCEGGGFVYTNRDSLSLGLVLGMKDLREMGLKPYDILSDFKAHPTIRDMIQGGEVMEYSAHVVSTGDMRSMPKQLYGDGVLIAGEAGNLLMNSGRAIQGMDYAMRSGIAAAETVIDASSDGDFSSDSLKRYQVRLDDSFVMKDLRRFQGAVHLLHDPIMYQKVPELLCDFGRSFFTVDSEPTEKAFQLFRRTSKKYLSPWELAKLSMRAAKSL